MLRSEQLNQLHIFSDLFQRYLVVIYAKVVSQHLLYIRNNPKKLRVKSYICLQDALRTDGDIQNMGQHIILPSSFTGGLWNMHDKTYGKPDPFVPFTSNTKRKEITSNLFPVLHLLILQLPSLVGEELLILCSSTF